MQEAQNNRKTLADRSRRLHEVVRKAAKIASSPQTTPGTSRDTTMMSHQHYGLLFDVRRSIRYHDRRRAFFGHLAWSPIIPAYLLVGGAVAGIASGASPHGSLDYLGVAIVLLAACGIALDWAVRENRHDQLRDRFAQLEADMLSGARDEATWRRHQLARLTIERDEPPVYRALDLLCHNAQLIAEGYSPNVPDLFSQIGWWPRLTCQLFYWPDIASRRRR